MGGRSGELALRHPSSLAGCTVHVRAPWRQYVVLAVFLVLHSAAFKACVATSGDAYKVALEVTRKRNREHTINGTKPEDLPPQEPLPSEWSPNSWASAALFASVSAHVLFYFMSHWRVKFKAWAFYTNATGVGDGCYVQVTPHAHRGIAEMVPISYSESSLKLGFTFQRQRYEYWEPKDLDDDNDPGEVRLVECPVDKPLKVYFDALGIRSEEEVDKMKEYFGDNRLNVQTPTFLECYKEQLLTPLVIFQVFVALLWAADDSPLLSLQQILFVLVFESTSVFQRLKTMNTLNSMGTKSYNVNVFRHGSWVMMDTVDLLPGDLVELTARAPPVVAQKASKEETRLAPSGDTLTKKQFVELYGGEKEWDAASLPDGAADKAAKEKAAAEAAAWDIVPCDCVIVRGDAIVSEASLTGESAPQMKDAIVVEDRALDMQGSDRVHSLFSGTKLLRSSEGSARKAGSVSGAEGAPGVPKTPEGGCLCFVVCTGFSSSQGELLQMIEFSQEKVSGDTKETLVALLVLLSFALVAAGYVLKEGLAKGEKTPHELILRCILILTVVVPRNLPMQMALAVNTALMALMRAGVYCTEPYRVPLAGKLTHCLFDKTGTLTTDTLLPSLTVNCCAEEQAATTAPPQTEVSGACPAAALVLSTCHSLVDLDGALSGDPIEVAALEGIGWTYDAEAETAKPGTDRKALADKGGGSAVTSAHIKHRFHFASSLQRMAVVAEVRMSGKPAGLEGGPGLYCLVKGSPEALGPLLAEGAMPAWFEACYVELAERGLRVLALAYRRMDTSWNDSCKPAREEVEVGLRFAGFIGFECKSRADSPLVIGALRESNHFVAMVTGDSPLTALHVARTCGISESGCPGLLLTARQEPGAGEPAADWVVATGERRGEKLALTEDIQKLAKEFTLIATGDALDAATEASSEFWVSVNEIRVFARMTPQGKAAVISQLQKQGKFALMCGDGGNDVGALKQADVGLALLAGYGNTNTTESSDEQKGGEANAESSGATKDAQTVLSQRAKTLDKRTKEAVKARKAFTWEKQKELQAKQKEWLEEAVQKGDGGMMSQFSAMKATFVRYQAELKRDLQEYDKTHGNIYDGASSSADMEKKMKDMKEKMESEAAAGGLPMVRPGDASVAAPFTSKAPSVKNCVDLIRQGRCTLLSALQQQQIMMLQCIISAYVLSALSLEGSRTSERQMMATQWMITIASLGFSYASSTERMHPVRPLRSLFHPAVFVSMLGQAALHLFCMVSAVKMARSAMELGSLEREQGWEGPSIKDVNEWWRVEKLRWRGYLEKEEEEEEDYMAQLWATWDRPFLPNLMNTVVFLVETAQTVAILFVNYKGQPWMKGLTENRALFFSVFIMSATMVAAAWEVFPEINALVHLSPFPNDSFRWRIMGLVFTTLFGTFLWDRACVAMFAPDIFRAMVDSAKSSTFKDDVLPIFMSAGKVVAGFLLLGTGNPLIIGGAYWYYKKYVKTED